MFFTVSARVYPARADHRGKYNEMLAQSKTCIQIAEPHPNMWKIYEQTSEGR